MYLGANIKDRARELNKYFSKKITKQIVTSEETEIESAVERKFKLNNNRSKINNENENEGSYNASLVVPIEISSSKIDLLGRIIYLLKLPEENIISNFLTKFNNLTPRAEASYFAPSINLISATPASAKTSIIKTNKNSDILRQKKFRGRRGLGGCHVPSIWGGLYYYCPIPRVATSYSNNSSRAIIKVTIENFTTESSTEHVTLETPRIFVNTSTNNNIKKAPTCRVRIGSIVPPFIDCDSTTPAPTITTPATQSPVPVTQSSSTTAISFPRRCKIQITTFGINIECENSVPTSSSISSQPQTIDPMRMGPKIYSSQKVSSSASGQSNSANSSSSSLSNGWNRNSTILTVDTIRNNNNNNDTNSYNITINNSYTKAANATKSYKKIVMPESEKLILSRIIYKELLRAARSSCSKSLGSNCILNFKTIEDLSKDITQRILNGEEDLSSFRNRTKELIFPAQHSIEKVTKFETDMAEALSKVAQIIEETLVLRDIATALPRREGWQRSIRSMQDYSLPNFFLTSPQISQIGIGNISLLS